MRMSWLCLSANSTASCNVMWRGGPVFPVSWPATKQAQKAVEISRTNVAFLFIISLPSLFRLLLQGRCLPQLAQIAVVQRISTQQRHNDQRANAAPRDEQET